MPQLSHHTIFSILSILSVYYWQAPLASYPDNGNDGHSNGRMTVHGSSRADILMIARQADRHHDDSTNAFLSAYTEIIISVVLYFCIAAYLYCCISVLLLLWLSVFYNFIISWKTELFICAFTHCRIYTSLCMRFTLLPYDRIAALLACCNDRLKEWQT